MKRDNENGKGKEKMKMKMIFAREKEVIRFNELPDMTEKYLSLCRSLDDFDCVTSYLYEIQGILKEKFDGVLSALDIPIYTKLNENLACAVAQVEASYSLMKSLSLSLVNYSSEFPFSF